MFQLILLLVLGLGMDRLLGDPRSRLHPVVLFGRMAERMENGCRRMFGDGIDAGLAGWLALTLLPAAVAAVTVRLTGAVLPWAGLFVAVIWLYITVALRSLCDHAQAIETPLKNGRLPEARRALSRIVSRDTDTLPESEIVRGGIESLGENLIDAVTSPLFWATVGYLAGGLPGAAAGAVWLRAVNTLDAMWGYRNERYLRFGRVAARMDDVAHFLPARLTLVAISLAAFRVGGAPGTAWRTGIRHRHDHPSPNSGYGMAGFAGALGIRLGGPTVYDGICEEYPYWGDGRSQLTVADLKRARQLANAATWVFVGILLAGAVLWRMFFT